MNKVIYRSPYIPEEWIASYGLEPVRFIPSRAPVGPIPDSEGVCPFMRAFINEALQTDACAIVMTTMCDQMRHGCHLAMASSSVPIFQFNLPSTWQSADAVGLFISELERLGDFLAGAGGTKPGKEQLVETILSHKRTFKPVVHNSRPGGIPVALLGSAMAMHDEVIFSLIEKAGGAIVMDGTEGGERTSPAPYNEERLQDDPLKELAEMYFKTIPDAFQRPNTPLYEWLDRMIRQSKPRGLIFVRQVWCDLWHVEAGRVSDLLEIPVLDLDMNGEESLGRTKTRIEAFMETLR